MKLWRWLKQQFETPPQWVNRCDVCYGQDFSRVSVVSKAPPAYQVVCRACGASFLRLEPAAIAAQPDQP